MSDIPVSSVVRVTISTAPTFPSRAGFGTLNIVGSSDTLSVQERAKIFFNQDEVADVFPPEAEERKASAVHFAQNPSPLQLVISRRIVNATPAEIRGGGNSSTDMAVWNGIPNGAFSITIDGVTAEVTAMDFSAVQDMDAVAAVVQSALQGADLAFGSATCTYSDTELRFYVRSGTTGVLSTILFATDPALGTPIEGTGLLEIDSANATREDGLDPETIPESLDAIQDFMSDWYGLAFTNEVRAVEADVVEAATWVESRIKVFGNDTDDNDVLDSVTTNDIGSQLKAKGYRRTMTCYNATVGEYLAVSALARAFIVNFNVANSTITLKFKQMPTITVAQLKSSQKTTLDDKNVNAFYSVGGNPMFGESFMASGVFFDEVHGIDWLQNAIETEVFGKLYTDTTKTPMTDSGSASLQDKTEGALAEGIRNGLGAPGFDRDGNFLSKGYVTSVLPMRDWSQSFQEARIGPPITFKFLGAGAIHGITIEGVFER